MAVAFPAFASFLNKKLRQSALVGNFHKTHLSNPMGGAHFGAFCPKSKPKGISPMALILNKNPSKYTPFTVDWQTRLELLIRLRSIKFIQMILSGGKALEYFGYTLIWNFITNEPLGN